MVYIKRKRKIRWIPTLTTLVLLGAGGYWVFNSIKTPNTPKADPEQVIEEVNETPILMGPDANANGLSDTQDIILGARADALAMPAYINAYYGGGYPPDNEGTCTDLVWRAFMNAGISLKDLVDADIKSNVKAYPGTWGYPDPNIDFRRVSNLKVFFERNALVLTNDVYEVDQWLPGDIVVFGNSEHIGIVSDIRNDNDIPFLIHNNDQEDREEDRLEYGSYTMGITGHYRFVSEN